MDNDVNLRTLVNDGGSAVISDYGAHLLRWAPAGQPDVVWTPSTWRIEPGKPLGGGVPICFPWFGPGFAHGRQLAITPSHGFARVRRWTLDEEGFTDDRVRYVMDSECLTDGEVPWLDDEPEARFRATYDVHAADTLTMSLTVVNTGDVPMSYEAALHSYLHVGDVSDAGLVGLRGATYLDATETGFPPRLQEPEAVTFGERRWIACIIRIRPCSCATPFWAAWCISSNPARRRPWYGTRARKGTICVAPDRANGVVLWRWRRRHAATAV